MNFQVLLLGVSAFDFSGLDVTKICVSIQISKIWDNGAPHKISPSNKK
jgi:hypothetical protein